MRTLKPGISLQTSRHKVPSVLLVKQVLPRSFGGDSCGDTEEICPLVVVEYPTEQGTQTLTLTSDEVFGLGYEDVFTNES